MLEKASKLLVNMMSVIYVIYYKYHAHSGVLLLVWCGLAQPDLTHILQGYSIGTVAILWLLWSVCKAAANDNQMGQVMVKWINDTPCI